MLLFSDGSLFPELLCYVRVSQLACLFRYLCAYIRSSVVRESRCAAHVSSFWHVCFLSIASGKSFFQQLSELLPLVESSHFFFFLMVALRTMYFFIFPCTIASHSTTVCRISLRTRATLSRHRSAKSTWSTTRQPTSKAMPVRRITSWSESRPGFGVNRYGNWWWSFDWYLLFFAVREVYHPDTYTWFLGGDQQCRHFLYVVIRESTKFWRAHVCIRIRWSELVLILW